uniref:Uncharacterized protein n=1 Tax=Arundo donax TaxID=35708 RepID=A0A0A9FLM1_ARUDO
MQSSVGPADFHLFGRACNRGSFITSTTGCNDLDKSRLFDMLCLTSVHPNRQTLHRLS